MAGLLEAHFPAPKQQEIDADGLARHLVECPRQRAVAEALLKARGYERALGRLLQAVEQRQAGA